MFHFGTFDNFKHYYLHFIRIHLKRDFPDAVSYNRFVELESRVFFKMMFFLMNLIAALGAYCFFDSKPEAIQGYCIEDTINPYSAKHYLQKYHDTITIVKKVWQSQ